jgi:hypothetical protein
MKVGIVLPEAGQQATRENVIRAAKEAEKQGLIHYGLGRDSWCH